MGDTPMKKKLDGKVAIITGGASGFGEATAHHFAALGARAVVIADIQDKRGHSVVESIGSNRCSYVHCDTTDEEQVKSLVDWTAKTYGRIDIMFANAGTASSLKQSLLDLDFSEYDRVLRVNARGTLVCVKQAARKMIELKIKGSIVCTGSVITTAMGPTQTDYIMSKFAVLGLMKTASLQLGAHGIRVNCVAPSAVATPLSAVVGLVTPDDVERAIEPVTSLKGVARSLTQLADAAAFLASDESSFVTGINLRVDGGVLSIPSFGK